MSEKDGHTEARTSLGFRRAALLVLLLAVAASGFIVDVNPLPDDQLIAIVAAHTAMLIYIAIRGYALYKEDA